MTISANCDDLRFHSFIPANVFHSTEYHLSPRNRVTLCIIWS